MVAGAAKPSVLLQEQDDWFWLLGDAEEDASAGWFVALTGLPVHW